MSINVVRLERPALLLVLVSLGVVFKLIMLVRALPSMSSQWTTPART